MDGSTVALLLAIIVLSIVALVRASAARRLARRTFEGWQELTRRVHSLEGRAQDSAQLSARCESLEKEVGELRAALAAREGIAPAAAPPPVSPLLPLEATGAEVPPRESPPPAPIAAPVPPPGAVAAPPPGAPPSPAAISEAAAPPIPVVHPVPQPPAREAARRALNLEEVLGTDWLNKLGVISVVIGVALFLAYQMREWGPAGKVVVGFAVSGGLGGAGVFFERRKRWQIMARAALGGGWALAFFTTYAMYHVAAARVLNSQVLDLVLLLGVAAAMVAHTLRYNSQVVTGLALLLGFTTVTISKSNVYCLSAGAILALALVIIVRQRRWYQLEIAGILASYLNHYYWLRPIINAMGGHRHPFPEFVPSAILLIFYWLVFRASYLLRRIPADAGPNSVQPAGERGSPQPGQGAEESVSTVAALLNTFLLLGVMKYQSVHPEWAFRFLLVLGAVEFALGQLPIARRRRAAFTVLSVLGATLMVAAVPFKYSGATLPVLWLAEAEALFLAGVFLGEILFCRLGLLAAMLVAFQLDRFALRQIFDTQWQGFHGGARMRGIMEFAVATLVFYGDAHWLGRRSPALAGSRFETAFLRVLSYVAGLTAVIGIWWLAPEPWVAVGFAALALLLLALGSRANIREFVYQARVVAALAFLRALVVNLGEQDIHHYAPVRLATVALTALLLYACARWPGMKQIPVVKYASSGHTWAASLLIGLLAWYELQPVGVAVAWTLLGLALFEIGRAGRLPQLRLQAYLAFLFSFARLFFVNFNATGSPGQLSPRFVTTVPLAFAFFYVYGVLDASRESTLEHDRRWRAGSMLCFLGTFTLAGWARFELDADWVVAAWAAMILALVAIAWRYERRIFLHQGLLLSAAVLARATLHNFYQRSYFPAPVWQSPRLTVGVTIALLLLALPFAFQLKRPPEEKSAQVQWWKQAFKALERRPEQVFFFIPLFLLTVLLALEVPRGMVTVAWGVEAVAIFLFALAMGQRSYRLSGLGLLMLCVAKILLLDVWGLQPRDRYLTFLVLGAALLGVSFLYTHYREAIRRYL